MTPFAVLLVDLNVTQIDQQQWNFLSYISYIGCSLSALFSAVTIFIYAFMKSSNRDTSIHIHVSLSAALFLLNISFLFTEWGATWSQNSACVLIAVIIEYSLLSCFSWMAIEALQLFLLLIKVFNIHIKHYMIKLSLFGWGLPAVLVGGSLCVYGTTPFYGTTEIKLSDTKVTKKLCWITDIRFLYGMNIGYFSITFLFNTCILVAVTYQIYKLRHMNVTGSNRPSCKDICTVLGLTLLLGTTWGLAFFTSGYTNYPVLYLFCICNTLQGLFLFLWVYHTMQRKRCLEAQSTTVSEPIPNTYENRFAQ
ncbi:adhesion G-protein coupled receptor G2 [Tachysurus vachellii]|uniref:adhesion G-protein coupled receptor G2 n=1 Tax=Tachysurus vachellii TaxID=175792 RepID=UPI00296AA0AC|nr:adhesion G-protein coupled receptor G2 [Tachysurus vachellii]